MRKLAYGAFGSAATAALLLGGAAAASAHHAHGASAEAATVNSPGVIAGNTVQVPVHIPVNLCGNTVSVIGALNPAFGNSCANVS
ncbi:membrane protein [Kitasatospora sp. MMS16-BH015]|uniref:chaplin n=1 Tax=Kitasatospora sp. MMS16-BH015 TaxID=2018025 RepID=UPI000CA1BD6E|nr:chaplin [Kitasatospora sp. MMS16-BH015]AUG77942.1 membrane protein [Kitasatospora sp. MMS16-BH015]